MKVIEDGDKGGETTETKMKVTNRVQKASITIMREGHVKVFELATMKVSRLLTKRSTLTRTRSSTLAIATMTKSRMRALLPSPQHLRPREAPERSYLKACLPGAKQRVRAPYRGFWDHALFRYHCHDGAGSQAQDTSQPQNVDTQYLPPSDSPALL